MIALAKAQPEKLNYASSGSGSSAHLAAELFNSMAGVKMNHIPYKGGGPAVIALVGGQCQVGFATTPSVVQHIKSGKIRALGVTGGQRSSGLPDVPTIAEAALPGFDVETWFALTGPAGLPAEFVQSTYQHLQKIMARPAVNDRLVSLGARPDLKDPAQTRAFIEAEARRWLPVIKEAGIKV